jgi:hypothetical protein
MDPDAQVKLKIHAFPASRPAVDRGTIAASILPK